MNTRLSARNATPSNELWVTIGARALLWGDLRTSLGTWRLAAGLRGRRIAGEDDLSLPGFDGLSVYAQVVIRDAIRIEHSARLHLSTDCDRRNVSERPRSRCQALPQR
jgi:hypothetical protein